MEILWTYERNGEWFDGDWQTKEAAKQYANDRFAEEFDDEPASNGSVEEEEAFLISFTYDNEIGERIEKTREKITLSFEHYHGDYAEHNTHWGL